MNPLGAVPFIYFSRRPSIVRLSHSTTCIGTDIPSYPQHCTRRQEKPRRVDRSAYTKGRNRDIQYQYSNFVELARHQHDENQADAKSKLPFVAIESFHLSSRRSGVHRPSELNINRDRLASAQRAGFCAATLLVQKHGISKVLQSGIVW